MLYFQHVTIWVFLWHKNAAINTKLIARSNLQKTCSARSFCFTNYINMWYFRDIIIETIHLSNITRGVTQIDGQSVLETAQGSLKYKLGFTVSFLFPSLTLLNDVFSAGIRFLSFSINHLLLWFCWFSLIRRETAVPVCSPKLSPVGRCWYLDGWPSR